MYLLQALGHLLEALAQTGLQRRMELLVHGLAHLLQLLLVVDLQRLQTCLHRQSHIVQAALVGV